MTTQNRTDGDSVSATQHAAAWRAANDRNAPHDGADIAATPLSAWDGSAGAAAVTFRRHRLVFTTRAPLPHVWEALSTPEMLLSDSRRIAPGLRTIGMNGGLPPATGDAYRLEDRRPARLNALRESLHAMGIDAVEAPDVRRADLIVARCGPFAGETGEIAFDGGANHPRAGRAALWVLALPDDSEGLRVELDAAEICRWAWEPDRLAAAALPAAGIDDGLVDWPWLFERLLAALDGAPEAVEPPLRAEGDWPSLAAREDVAEALRLHSPLADIAARLGRER